MIYSDKKTILVVDDNVSNVDVLLSILEEYDIIASLDGDTALNILSKDNVDLILLDIMMPEMDGFEVCQRIKKDPKINKIPIVFLSAKDNIEDIKKGFELGAVDYVSKPFNPIELKSRIKTHLRLRSYEQELETRVNYEIEKSKDKDKMIFHQNKLSSMGEMIENIAHQWRQPLSQINSALLIVDDELYNMNIENELLEEKLTEIESLTKYMSETIDDFKDFIKKDMDKKLFNIKSCIDNAVSIIKGSLDYYSIELSTNIIDVCEFKGYPNELQQVILVILNNAKDVLISKEIKDPKISISLERIDKICTIKICDNAGGIDNTIIDKVFDPYFTTKHKSQGTGLGLYLSKKIIEQSTNGSIYVKNSQNGACFYIELES
ncbi:MAG: hybrid sensor histidine kinase/response regulator [Campylobacterota bacterium]|nr:hybrid sensor histidine kinase/response regulator [Campylobacterota bacterium]